MCPSVSGECRWGGGTDPGWGFGPWGIETGLESGCEITEGMGKIRKQGGRLTLLALGRRSL